MSEELAVATLRQVSTSSEVNRPLQSVASSALWVAHTAKSYKHSKKEWLAFAEYIQLGVACVLVILNKDCPPSFPASEAHIRALDSALDSITTDMQIRMAPDFVMKGIRSHFHNRRRIKSYMASMDQALAMFNIGNAMSSHNFLMHVLENQSSTLKSLNRVHTETTRVGLGVVRTLSNRANLDLLPYVSGAAWNPQRGVLRGTRSAVLDDAMRFVRDVSSSSPRILLVEGALGSGKTAIANSIASLCSDTDGVTLLSSFFFGRGDSPDALLSTMAHDLSKKLEAPLAEMISDAIERNKSLLSPPLGPQFEHLILRPAIASVAAAPVSQASSHTRAMSEVSSPETISISGASTSPTTAVPVGPLVIVIDALDALTGTPAFDDLLRVLTDGVSALPACFRFIITTRPSLPISSALHAHFRPYSLDSSSSASGHIVRYVLTQDEACKDDVATFARYSLAQLRIARQLGESWPGEELEDRFAHRARDVEGGSFVWVSVVCDFLRTRSVNPAGQLERLLSEDDGDADGLVGMLEKLDAMFAQVLADAPWQDRDFVRAYQGAFADSLELKQPLSSSALDALSGVKDQTTVGCAGALKPLASLFSDLDQSCPRLELAHSSLKGFVLQRAAASSNEAYRRFAIDATQTGASLSLRLLRALNERLSALYPQSTVLPPSTSTSVPLPSTPRSAVHRMPSSNSILTATPSGSPLVRPRLGSFTYPSTGFLGAAPSPSSPGLLSPLLFHALPSPPLSASPSSPTMLRTASSGFGRSRSRAPSDASTSMLGLGGVSEMMVRTWSGPGAVAQDKEGTDTDSGTPARPRSISYSHHHHHHHSLHHSHSWRSPVSPPRLPRMGSTAVKFEFSFDDAPTSSTASRDAILEYGAEFWLAHLCDVAEPGDVLLETLAAFLNQPALNPPEADGLEADSNTTKVLGESHLMHWLRLAAMRAAAAGEESGVRACLAGWLERLVGWSKSVDFDLWSHADRARLAIYLQALSSHLVSPTSNQQPPLDVAISLLRSAIVLRRQVIYDQPRHRDEDNLVHHLPVLDEDGDMQTADMEVEPVHHNLGAEEGLTSAESALAGALHALSGLLALKARLDRSATEPSSLLTTESLAVESPEEIPSEGVLFPTASSSASSVRDQSAAQPYPSASSDLIEAMDVIREAVALRRKLTSLWPALYAPALAGSLEEFAARLEESGKGHSEEAEMARSEASMLRNGKHSSFSAPSVRSRRPSAVASSSAHEVRLDFDTPSKQPSNRRLERASGSYSPAAMRTPSLSRGSTVRSSVGLAIGLGTPSSPPVPVPLPSPSLNLNKSWTATKPAIEQEQTIPDAVTTDFSFWM